jgi:hypothetical protein
MGSALGLDGLAEPPTTSLLLLSVATSPPGSTDAAAPQSQGSPLLGHICTRPAPVSLN